MTTKATTQLTAPPTSAGAVYLQPFKFYRSVGDVDVMAKGGDEADELAQCWVDPTREVPPVDFLLRCNGVGILPRGDIQGMAGREKSGKTTAALAMVIALLNGRWGYFEAADGLFSVAVIDTEQSAANVSEKRKMVHRAIGWPEDEICPRLNFFSLAPYDVAKRRALVGLVERYKPDLVVLDGIKDICDDMNDNVKSTEAVQIVMRLAATGCAVLCVLHQPKSGDGMRGHLGTELANKCSEWYRSERDTTGAFTVTQEVSRNAPAEAWHFTVEDGTPVPCSTHSAADARRTELLKQFGMLFKEQDRYNSGELAKAYTAKFGGQERAANERMREAFTAGILTKTKKGVAVEYTFCLPLLHDEPDNVPEDVL